MGPKPVQFLAVLLTALALVPAGAHFFALSAKIELAQEAYFTVQQIYRGWAWFGIVIFAAIAANITLALLVRRQPQPFWFALAAGALLVAMLAIFFIWTFPANQATRNWALAPDTWHALRRQREYSHAVNAVLTFAALCCAQLASLLAPPARDNPV